MVLGQQSFVYLADPSRALTPESEKVKAKQSLETILKEVDGLVVVTQSCDIVRSCEKRPFIEVAPLVKVADKTLKQIKNRRRPRYAFIPVTAERFLVADLDRVMTVEKSVVMSWERTPGCKDSDEVRRFAEALASKRDRFAFPDDFVELIKELRKYIISKHNKVSEEGKFLRALREIRVRAAPDWGADQVDLHFWFILKDEPLPVEPRDKYRKKLLGMTPPRGKFSNVEISIEFLKDLTASDYVDSEQLDWNYLSASERGD